MDNLSTQTATPLWLLLFINHTAILVVSIVIMLAAGRGKLARYGFQRPSGMRIRRIILWGLGVGFVSEWFQQLAPGEGISIFDKITFIQVILFIWIYASVSEEVLVRGLVQSSLAPLLRFGLRIFGSRISLPVLIGAIFFGFLHLTQLAMGASIDAAAVTVAFAFVLGVVAGYYREETGSLLPAVLVHMFANVGCSLAEPLLRFFA